MVAVGVISHACMRGCIYIYMYIVSQAAANHSTAVLKAGTGAAPPWKWWSRTSVCLLVQVCGGMSTGCGCVAQATGQPHAAHNHTRPPLPTPPHPIQNAPKQ